MGGKRSALSVAGVTSASKKFKSTTSGDAVDLRGLLPLLVSATSLSLRFLSDSSLLLPSSLALPLSSSLLSSSRSLSLLLSILPSSLLPPPPLPPSSWFHGFISSSPPSNSRWIHYFRMSKPTFDLLLQTLSPSLDSGPDSSPPSHKLAAALLRLAHAAPFPDLARRFSLGSPSLACRAFYQVCRALAERLSHLLELPADPQRVIQGFDCLSLPNCCGVVGFSRFSIDGAANGGAVVAQAVVDSEGRFLDVSVGWHGEMTPHRVLANTRLFKNRTAAVVAAGGCVELEGGGGGLVPMYFLGGPCCPLLPWLITPFREADGKVDEPKFVLFNRVHARGMELASQAFRRVRSRWQLLGGIWKEECVEALPYVVVASCLLHNFLIRCGEPVVDEFGQSYNGEQGFREFEGKRNEEGERVREVLASHLSMVSQTTVMV